jgi:hypothetical protein
MDNGFDDGRCMSGHQSRTSRQSRDPDADRSVRSGVPPLPRSVRSSGGLSRHYEPDGMSHKFGADNPDDRHYTPGG